MDKLDTDLENVGVLPRILPKTLLVTVTQKNIDRGRDFYDIRMIRKTHCPIALALYEMGYRGAEVGCTEICLGAIPGKPGSHLHGALPPLAIAFVHAFDHNSREIHPFTFDVTLEESRG